MLESDYTIDLNQPYGDLSTDELPESWRSQSFSLESYRAAREYLLKYFMSYEDYTRFWKPLSERVFNPQAVCMTNGPSCQAGYEGILMPNEGRIFTRKTFLALQRCMRVAGDTCFAIIMDVRNLRGEVREPYLRTVYPVNISYEELLRDDLGMLSEDMDSNYGELYVVLGDSGMWGKCVIVETDYAYGFVSEQNVDLIGFHPAHATLFAQEFGRMISNHERKMLCTELPPSLRAHYMKWLPEVIEVDPLLTSKVWYE